MASQVVKYRVDESTVVGFEFEPRPEWHQAGSKDVAGWVREAVAPAVDAARVVLEKAKDARPSEVRIKFGITVTGEANWIVAKATTGSSFEVTLTWSSGDGSASAGAVAG